MTADNTTAASLNDLASLCRDRAATYRLLSRLYASELDAELLATLRAMRLPARSGNELIDEGYHLIARYLGGFWDESFTESSVQFARAFVGYGTDGHSAAYPYESVYTSEKRLTMQDSRDDVMSCYLRHDLMRSDALKENEDHLSIELEFMGTLSERTAALLEAGDADGAADLLDAQRDFAERHLLNWIGAFASDVRHFSDSDLYQGAAQLTEGFIAEDARFLRDVIADD